MLTYSYKKYQWKSVSKAGYNQAYACPRIGRAYHMRMVVTDMEGLVVPILLWVDDDPSVKSSQDRLMKFVFEDAGVAVDLVWADTTEEGLGHLSETVAMPKPQGVIVDGLGGRCWEITDVTQQLLIPHDTLYGQ
jgi:hypothetical protein